MKLPFSGLLSKLSVPPKEKAPKIREEDLRVNFQRQIKYPELEGIVNALPEVVKGEVSLRSSAYVKTFPYRGPGEKLPPMERTETISLALSIPQGGLICNVIQSGHDQTVWYHGLQFQIIEQLPLKNQLDYISACRGLITKYFEENKKPKSR